MQIHNTISVDPTILETYFFGAHEQICFSQEHRWCSEFSKYSEKITIVGATTTIFTKDSTSLKDIPVQFAFFDKKFYLPVIKDAYEEVGLPFSQSNFDVNLLILNGKEVDAQKIDVYSILEPSEKLKSLKKVDPIIVKNGNGVFISTLDYKNYGKYILAPKGDLVESQYLDVKLASKMPKDEDFGIMSDGGQTVISPLTSPISSIVNNWKYILIDNKITLVYVNSVATLDNGKTKVLAQNDEFTEEASAPTADNSSSTLSVTTGTSNQLATEGGATPEERKVSNILSKFIAVLKSWFKF